MAENSMTQRRTGRYVQMELVWVGDALRLGPFDAAYVTPDVDHRGYFIGELNREVFGLNALVKRSRSLAAVQRAVEDAVTQCLGTTVSDVTNGLMSTPEKREAPHG